MDNFVNKNTSEVQENVIAGIVGALLFSLAGAVIYFVLHLVGYIASISGLIGAVCAVKGYAVFAKKESKKGIIIAAIISLLVIVLAWFLGLAYDVYDSYKLWYESGDVDYTLTFIESVRVAPIFLKEPEIAKSYLGDLAISVLFTLLGAGSYIFNKIKNANKQPAPQPQTQAYDPYSGQFQAQTYDPYAVQSENNASDNSASQDTPNE